MARFYKTASANPLDYMYRINTPLMERVIGANDEYITQNLSQAQQLGNLASSFPYLQSDDERAKNIVQGYSKQVDDITQAIRDDPANWRRQLDPMRNLSKDLQQNYKVGEISKIASNYNQYKTVADEIDKQVGEYNKTGKGISADRARAYKQYFLNNFKGTNYNPKTGEYSSMNAFTPMGNIDIRKALSEEMDKIKSDKTKYKRSDVTGDEWYYNDTTKEWEGVTPERILQIATDRLYNPQLQDYMRQDSQIGLLNGIYDNEGKMIAPYNYKGVPISPDEQKSLEDYKSMIAKTKDRNLKAQMQNTLDKHEQELKNRTQLEWNNQSYLSPILRGIVSQYAYNKTDDESTLRNNSKGSTQFVQSQTNARQAANLAQQRQLAADKEKGINDRFKQNLDWQKWKWEHPQEKTGKGTGTAKGKTPADTTVPVESSISKFATNSFEDWKTPAGDKVLSNVGLSSDIDRLKGEEADATKTIGDLDKRMKDLKGNRTITDLSPAETRAYNNMLLQKQETEKKLPQIQSDLGARRKWYEASVDAALSNNFNAKKDRDGVVGADLTPEEIQIYKEGEAGQKRRNDQAMQYLKQAQDISLPLGLAPEEFQKRQAKIDDLRKKARDLGYSQSGTLIEVGNQSKEYQRVKKIVDQRRDNFLDKIRYTPIDSDAIQLGTEDSKSVGQMILSNLEGTKIFDNTGNRTDGIDLEGDGKSKLYDPFGWGKGNKSWHSPGYDNYSFTTDQYTPSKANGNQRNLLQYMADHGVKMNVEQVGKTTKIGSGNALAKVSFEDPNGEIGKQSYYIELTPELQKQVGKRLSENKSADVKSYAGGLLDEESNDIRRQLITPTVTRTAGKVNQFDPVTFTIFIGNGNHKVPFQVTKFANEDGTDNLTITGSQNGVQVPLPNTPSGVPGLFHGADDFINYIQRIKGK